MFRSFYFLSFQRCFLLFCLLMSEKTKDKEMDTETHFKDTFRVFSKDEEGWSNMKTYRMSQKCPFIALYS